MPEKRYFICRNETPMELDVCGQLISPDGFCHHRRTFECHVLILVQEGTLHITANGVRRTVRAGEYLFLRAGEEHFGHQASRGRLAYLWLHVRSIHTFEVEEDDAPYAFAETGSVVGCMQVEDRFSQLLAMTMEEPPCPPLMRNYACSLLMMELTRAQGRQRSGSEPPVVLAAQTWIRANYHRPFPVTELAQQMGYQADYLASLFRQHTGMTIVQYTTQLRMRMAKALLAHYDVSIREVAYSCGFADEKYFMRQFKRQEGITPTQFREQRSGSR